MLHNIDLIGGARGDLYVCPYFIGLDRKPDLESIESEVFSVNI